MATDDEIVSNLETLLSQADLAQATHGSIREQLEAKLGQDLSHKKLFIRHQIDLLAHKHQQKQQQQQQQQQQHFHHHLQHTQGIDISYPPAVPLPLSGEFVGMPTSFHAAAAAAAAAAVKGPYEHVTVQRPVVVQEVPVPVPVPVTKQSRSTKQASNAAPGVKRRGGPGGLNKVCGVSPELQAVVGEPAMPRTQIVKQLWAYIRKNNLQDPSNKRKIICDEALRVVFETDCTDMFKMNKLLAKHILPLEAPKESAAPEPKRMKPSFNEDIKVESSGAGPPLIMSPSLAKFFNTGERELPQAEAVNRIWTYIQMNRLQDPATSMVVCDYRLAELFGCERFPALSLSEMLVQHFMHR